MPLFRRREVKTSDPLAAAPATVPASTAIAVLGLADWWATLSDAQRQMVRDVSAGSELATDAPIDAYRYVRPGVRRAWHIAAIGRLATLCDPVDRALAVHLADIAVARANAVPPSLDAHFAFSQAIDVYRGGRERPREGERWEAACRAQVAIASDCARLMRQEHGPTMPGHRGYRDLIRITTGTPEAERLAADRDTQGWQRR